MSRIGAALLGPLEWAHFGNHKGAAAMFLEELTDDFRVDDAGTPTGGSTRGVGLKIDWQEGPLVRDGVMTEPNGARVEGVVTAALSRLRFYQTTKFSCRENEQAILKLEEALLWLHHRSVGREQRGVKGTHAT
jgi:hypothetical protein